MSSPGSTSVIHKAWSLRMTAMSTLQWSHMSEIGVWPTGWYGGTWNEPLHPPTEKEIANSKAHFESKWFLWEEYRKKLEQRYRIERESPMWEWEYTESLWDEYMELQFWQNSINI